MSYLVPISYTVAFMYVAPMIWRFYGLFVINHPINSWLLESLAGWAGAYRTVLAVHDLLANIAFAIPFAVLASWLTHSRSIGHYAVIAITSICYTVLNMVNHAAMFQNVWFLFGLIATIIPLLAAYYFVGRIYPDDAALRPT